MELEAPLWSDALPQVSFHIPRIKGGTASSWHEVQLVSALTSVLDRDKEIVILTATVAAPTSLLSAITLVSLASG